MKIKLINVENFPEVTTVGTCELCYSTRQVDNPVFHFEKEDGTQLSVDGYYWSWGDYDQVWIDNVVDFAAFISGKDYPEHTVLNCHWLFEEVWEYEISINTD